MTAPRPSEPGAITAPHASAPSAMTASALPSQAAAPSAAPIAPSRRGACPALTAPMQTGDGLLVRVNTIAGSLPPKLLTGLCELAQRHGNGIVEVRDGEGLATGDLPGVGHCGRVAALEIGERRVGEVGRQLADEGDGALVAVGVDHDEREDLVLGGSKASRQRAVLRGDRRRLIGSECGGRRDVVHYSAGTLSYPVRLTTPYRRDLQ